jgi:spore coat polysaccharide biosynthesis protein SpsF (cytidylyltransferase family)
MKTVCIVQARTGSQRLPLKVLAALHGKPMLAHVLERAAAIPGVDEVCLAIPESDKRLLGYLWPVVSYGPENDVLTRYLNAACSRAADVIVRVTGDCPLLAPDLAGRAVRTALALSACGYVAMCMPYVPVADGWDVEVFSYELLAQAAAMATGPQREHVTTWMRENYKVWTPAFLGDDTHMKLSVDTREDLAVVDKVMAALDDPKDFSYQATARAWRKVMA